MSKATASTSASQRHDDVVSQDQPSETRQEQARDMFTIDPSILAGAPAPRLVSKDGDSNSGH